MRKSVKKSVERFTKKSVRKTGDEPKETKLSEFKVRQAEHLLKKELAKPKKPKPTPKIELPKETGLEKQIIEAQKEIQKVDYDVDKKSHLSIWIIAAIGLFIGVSIISYFFIFTAPVASGNCSDGTLWGECSITKPMECTVDADLYSNPLKCACPTNERVYQNKCVPIVECVDGTLSPECSFNKPLQCKNNELIANPAVCGCPVNEYLFENNCQSLPTCSDNTLYGDCSLTKPLFCENGLLVELPSVCGESEEVIQRNLVEEAFDHINYLRANHTRSVITWDERAYDLGIARAKDMFERNYLDHVTPEGTCAKSIKAEYGFSEKENAAENIWKIYYEEGSAVIEANPNLAVTSWMTSRPHRYNLLYEHHSSGAVSCYKNICMFFGVNNLTQGFGAAPCTSWDDSHAFWVDADTQAGEV